LEQLSQRTTPGKEQRGTKGENWSIIAKQLAREIGGRKESELNCIKILNYGKGRPKAISGRLLRALQEKKKLMVSNTYREIQCLLEHKQSCVSRSYV
jgi:hypothetical protein